MSGHDIAPDPAALRTAEEGAISLIGVITSGGKPTNEGCDGSAGKGALA